MKPQPTRRSSYKPVIRFTLADRVLVTGQRLRLGEAITSTTLALQYAAKWRQAIGGAR